MTLHEAIELFWPSLLAAGAIALLCAALSVFVVLRRLAFMGQGVSHAAFGGVGVAAALGLTGGARFGVVGVFCLGVALAIGRLAGRRGAAADTLIGIFLVGSMALGALLLAAQARLTGAQTTVPWEEILFGSILAVGPLDALLAWVVALGALAALLAVRAPMLFWAFDEPAAEAFGVSTERMKLLLVTMIALTIVVAMKLAGVVLATALLVLPGAIGLRLSRRLAPVFWLSGAAAIAGLFGGLALAFTIDLPAGACVVGMLVALYAIAWPIGTLRGATVRF